VGSTSPRGSAFSISEYASLSVATSSGMTTYVSLPFSSLPTAQSTTRPSSFGESGIEPSGCKGGVFEVVSDSVVVVGGVVDSVIGAGGVDWTDSVDGLCCARMS
jgi:hypothetical protein